MCYNILGKYIKGELDTDWKLIRKATVKNRNDSVAHFLRELYFT